MQFAMIATQIRDDSRIERDAGKNMLRQGLAGSFDHGMRTASDLHSREMIGECGWVGFEDGIRFSRAAEFCFDGGRQTAFVVGSFQDTVDQLRNDCLACSPGNRDR